MRLDIKKSVNIFIISSFVSLITIGYVGQAYTNRGCPANVPYELFPIFIPLLYGIFGLVNYYVTEKFGSKYSFLVGMLFGLLLSFIGRFGLNLPELIFDFTKKTEYKVHIYAMVLYAGIFQFLITPLTDYIIIN
jgi:hypothetical protein